MELLESSIIDVLDVIVFKAKTTGVVIEICAKCLGGRSWIWVTDMHAYTMRMGKEDRKGAPTWRRRQERCINTDSALYKPVS